MIKNGQGRKKPGPKTDKIANEGGHKTARISADTAIRLEEISKATGEPIAWITSSFLEEGVSKMLNGTQIKIATVPLIEPVVVHISARARASAKKLAESIKHPMARVIDAILRHQLEENAALAKEISELRNRLLFSSSGKNV